MYTPELISLLQRLIPSSKANFLGVFPRDQIPHIDNTLTFPLCFVVNTDPSSKPGEHWVALYYTSPSSSEFFDSYGLSPKFYHIPITPTRINHKTLQSLDSDVCGQYCIYYLYHRSRARSLTHILSGFSSHDLAWNDNSVAHFVSRMRDKHRITPMRQAGGSLGQCCVKRNSLTLFHDDE